MERMDPEREREREERQWVVRRRRVGSLSRSAASSPLSSFGRSLIWVIEGVTETNKWDDHGDIETNERGREKERAPRQQRT